MKRVRIKNSVWVLGLGFAAAPHGTSASLAKQPQMIEKLPSTLQPLHKSLLFDQSFDEAPLRPFLPERIVAQYIENSEAPRTPAKIEKPAPVAASQVAVEVADEPETSPLIEVVSAPPTPLPVRERETKEILKDLQEENKISIPSRSIPKLKSLQSARAGVYVVDETAFLENRFESVPEATVHWLHPKSGLSSSIDTRGLAFAPYPNAYSARYIVNAPGYLPAVGYAVKGMLSPVVLYRDSRLGPILKSLNQSAQPGKTMLIGKFLDRTLKPIEKMSFDQFLSETQTSFYSLGLFGLFHPGARETGPRGDFMVNDLQQSLQYLLAKKDGDPTQLDEWPAQLVDLKGLYPVLTTTFVEPRNLPLSTQLVDAFSLTRPNTGIYASIGGQRGLVEPDSNGILDLADTHERPNVDLIEIHAQGYMKTWLNIPAVSEALPDFVPLFTHSQLAEVLNAVGASFDPSNSYVAGSIRPENTPGHLELKIYGSDGKMNRSAQVFYFGSDNSLSASAPTIDPQDARFMIAGLPDGEWHLVLVDAKTGHGHGIQVVRTQGGTLSQIQF
jgi:hypothetical protein